MESASDKTVEAGLEQGFVRVEGQNAGFMDPVRVLSASYELHEIKSERYYSRAFFTSLSPLEVTAEDSGIKKRKRKRKVYTPNEKEAIAESRHQEVRSVILEAHEAFQATVAPFLRRYIAFSDDDTFPTKNCSSKQKSVVEEGELNFVEAAALWQAPLYEISSAKSINGQVGCKDEEFMSSALFNTVFENSSTTSGVAQCGGCKYLLPRLSKFLISDIAELHQLIPGVSEEGFNLIVIDPPWENKSVHRKALYPTIPNRYLLSLPVRQLAHADGALVALWITNREKLRHFVETELFPAWGVSLAAVWYWLQVTAEGTMVSSLDLAHHKPYECLLLGFLPSIGAPTAMARQPRVTYGLLQCCPGQVGCKDEEFMSSALFNTVFENSSTTSGVAQCGGCKYLLPRLSKFLISDIAELHQLIPGVSEEGFNLIVIDPPWENKSVHRKALYPTIPNRYLLSLPVRQLAHADGALVALWITNREKLRHFVETELFPAWGVSLAAVWYWLQVTAEGTMVSSLDLAHHKPYECLLLGFLPSIGAPTPRGESVESTDSRERALLPNKYVLMSIPGDHSRKPPVKSILSKYIPGHREADKGLELFARELNAGWTSWGNEPLRFQHVNYFRERQSLPVTASSKC